MSDAGSGNDDFDREAEREKLREQFEADEREREATQRMSELLLQGATMTNRHCDTCGDPIFRHEGQEFCPGCRGTGAQSTQQQGQAPERGRTPEQGQNPAQDRPPGQGRPANPEQAPGGRSAPDAGETAAPDRRTQDQPTAREQSGRADPAVDAAGGNAGGDAAPVDSTALQNQGDTPSRSARPEQQRNHSAAGGDLDAAEASLTRTVNELARRAASADDLGRGREYLAAVSEAAEALRAVREARR